MSFSLRTIQSRILILQQFKVVTPSSVTSSPNCDAATGANSDGVSSQKVFGEIWKSFYSNSHIYYEPNIQRSLDFARKLGMEAGGMHTLITGSQHLIGGALFSLNYYAAVQ